MFVPEEQLEKSVKAFRENLSNSTIERYIYSKYTAFLYIRALQFLFLSAIIYIIA